MCSVPSQCPAGRVAPEMFVDFLGYHLKCYALIIPPVLLLEIGQLTQFLSLRTNDKNHGTCALSDRLGTV